MTTVKGKSGRVYEVRSQLYGKANLVHRLYLGGVCVAANTGANTDVSLEALILRADKRAEGMWLEEAQGGIRSEDLHFRVTPEEKVLLEVAASAEGRSLSNYLLIAGLERAKK